MITSNMKNKQEAYVWIFLPGKTNAVVAGKMTEENALYSFRYGQSYLENSMAMPLSPFELPLTSDIFFPTGLNVMPACIRDAGPDAWGRRLIDYKYANLHANELDYLLLSGSNRIGALDFQESSKNYLPRESKNVSLEDLLQVSELVLAEKPIPKALEYALIRGTSVGGARPKALIQHQGKEYIAKFGLTQDTFNPIKAEFIGMQLAKAVGIDVPSVFLQKALHKDILMIERFDRVPLAEGMSRKLMLSALSLLKLNEMEARYASYIDLSEIIRQSFKNPKRQMQELYKRLIFNILIGNTDDHARNHSAFWDGQHLELTPAYDICPQSRIGREATQAMAIQGAEGNFSTLNNVLSVCEYFQIDHLKAKEMIEKMIQGIKENWETVCEAAKISLTDKEKLWEKSVLNPFCFQNWDARL